MRLRSRLLRTGDECFTLFGAGSVQPGRVAARPLDLRQGGAVLQKTFLRQGVVDREDRVAEARGVVRDEVVNPQRGGDMVQVKRAGATVDVGVVVVVDGVVLLLAGPLPPPPQPTANTSMAAPPKSATAFLA